MNLSELSVRRPVTGIMVFLVLTLLGTFAFSRLKLDMLPSIEFPMVAVIASYPGAGPEEVEQLVTRPLESAMASVDNVEDITSTSKDGASLLLVKFAWGTDMDVAEQDVRKNMEVYALDALPDDVDRPISFAFNPSMQPVMFLSVEAPGTPQAVRRLADEQIGPFLSRVDGVASADVMGGIERQIQVRVRPEWLEAYQIPVSQVVGALRAANVVIPGGNLDQGVQELSIVTDAEFTSVAQVADVVVGQKNGIPVHLREVADVVDGFEEQTHLITADGRPGVMMALRKQSDANTVQVVGRLYKAIGQLNQRLPEGARVTSMFDQAEAITLSIRNLAGTALVALFFTGAVLLAFLRSWRSSSIALVSIPLSVLATFTVMDFGEVTLNIISMAGLALAVGMLVDNAIVVLENIFRRMEAGEDRKTAAIGGTREVAMPITASTLTTIAVFAPVLFVPGLAGQLFRDMALTIVISLSASLVVTITLVPLLASLLLGKKKQGRVEQRIAALTAWIDPLSDRYGRVLLAALRHRVLVVLSAVGFFVSVMVAGALLLGWDMLGNSDQGFIELEAEAAPGSSVSATGTLVRSLETLIREEIPEAKVVQSEWGTGDGFAALFGGAAHKATVRISLPPREERARSQAEIEERLRERFAEIPGFDVRPRPQGMPGMGGEGAVVVQVFGDDLDRIREYGSLLKRKLSQVEGAADVSFSLEEGRPELRVRLDRDQIALLGLTPAEVAATINTYFMGTRATMYREAGDEFSVLVRAPRAIREDIARLRNLPVVTPLGVTVPLQTVASVDTALGPTAVERENQRRKGSIAINQTEDVDLKTLIDSVKAVLEETPADPGLSVVLKGTAEDFIQALTSLIIAILVAILLVYMVMASQFESLLEPFVILFSVPLALAGVVLGLLVTGTTVHMTALIGVILLAGVVVNNGIVLIDVLKRRRAEGMPLVDAAVEAGTSRLRPILMTSLTTILGMLPLAFGWGTGGEMWAPMARAVIGGMTVSSLLTLVVVPVLYVSIAGRVDRRRARKAARRAALGDLEAPRRHAA